MLKSITKITTRKIHCCTGSIDQDAVEISILTQCGVAAIIEAREKICRDKTKLAEKDTNIGWGTALFSVHHVQKGFKLFL
mmetsp:Transcript_701/g.4504  ORF Transcript_701/g.4504 Transcript_701/m.4504 type:complete len:80 (+) Transcript_701:610-849(+)